MRLWLATVFRDFDPIDVLGNWLEMALFYREFYSE